MWYFGALLITCHWNTFQISFNPFHRSVVVTSGSDGFIRSTDLEADQMVDITYKWYNFRKDWSHRIIGFHQYLSVNQMMIAETDLESE